MSERIPIRIGGLMRCCTGTLRECYDGPEDEGARVLCKWCGEPMVVRDGAWEWDHPRDDPPATGSDSRCPALHHGYPANRCERPASHSGDHHVTTLKTGGMQYGPVKWSDSR